MDKRLGPDTNWLVVTLLSGILIVVAMSIAIFVRMLYRRSAGFSDFSLVPGEVLLPACIIIGLLGLGAFVLIRDIQKELTGHF